MIILTFVIGVFAVKTRFVSVKKGEVSVKYYKLMHGEDVPETVTKTTRCFNNQFEIPVLFYAGCTLYISLGVESFAGIILAWVFVALRCIHAYIHLTYNNVIHRMSAFWLAFISVVILWLNLVVNRI
jgi:hypothetical protein